MEAGNSLRQDKTLILASRSVRLITRLGLLSLSASMSSSLCSIERRSLYETKTIH